MRCDWNWSVRRADLARVGSDGWQSQGVPEYGSFIPSPTLEIVNQRAGTPNLAIPMDKRDLSVEEQNKLKPFYPELFAYRERCFGGFCFDLDEKNTFDVPAENREKFYTSASIDSP